MWRPFLNKEGSLLNKLFSKNLRGAGYRHSEGGLTKPIAKKINRPSAQHGIPTAGRGAYSLQAAVHRSPPNSGGCPSPGTDHCPRLPGALLVTIRLQTLAALVLVHLETALLLEVTHT